MKLKQVYLAYLVTEDFDDLTDCDKAVLDGSPEIDDIVICVVQCANARSVRKV